MRKLLAVIYGALCYAFFFVSFLYSIGFVENRIVPKSIDHPGDGRFSVTAVAIDLVLLTIFAVQHSGMARQAFKRQLTKLVNPAIERSTYVLAATAALDLLLWKWQPISHVMWRVPDHTVAGAIKAVSLVGWLLVLFGTFHISHSELFGLKQVMAYFRGESFEHPSFRVPALYRIVRHPIYLGFLIAFWAAPTMTAGHLLFTVATTGYIFVGASLEERDLMSFHGDAYREYRKQVPMLIPTGRHVPRKTESAKGAAAK
jgi:protein-S-isoprenylcysteine O-methyltransferase Ste14